MDTRQTPQVQLVCGGDLMLGRGVNDLVGRWGAAYVLEELQPLLRGSFLAVNLECAISSEVSQYSGPPKTFYFRADSCAINVLREAGVRLVSLANNHALDADREGLGETLKILEKNSIFSIGAGPNRAQAEAPRVVEAGGLRLGWLAACDHQQDFEATETQPGIRIVEADGEAELRRLAADVADLRQRTDAIVVSWHWQSNWEPTLRPKFRQAAHRLIEAGATLIWGHGPHHFQGVERIGHAAVLYSTGDLADDYATDDVYRNDRQLLFKVSLDREGVAGIRAHPLELDYARTRPAGEEARRWIVHRFKQMCAELGQRVLDGGDEGLFVR